MRFTLRADDVNAVHTTFTVFVNGGNAGQLIMRHDEAIAFKVALGEGTFDCGYAFKSTGEWEVDEG